jgi:hypothetical protein
LPFSAIARKIANAQKGKRLLLLTVQDYKAQPQEQLLSAQLVEAYATSENNPKYCTGCTCSKVYVYTIIDIRPRQDRKESFDIRLHKHLKYTKKTITEIKKEQEQEQKEKQVA